LRHR
jgi:transposase